jgi:polyisoprenoid-binding protein YceI
MTTVTTASAPASATRSFAGLTVPAPGTFVLDPAHTAAAFVARHLMVSKVRGSFGQVTGEITIAEDPLDSTVTVRIPAAGIDTGIADRDTHLRSADFLDVATYPELRFRSLRVSDVRGNTFTLVGELTIRDVTREVALDVEFEGVAQSPWGGEVIGFTASTEIDREDFGITWNQALEAGGVLVGKAVKIEISAEGIREV